MFPVAPPAGAIRVARVAMATRFELFLTGPRPGSLRAAAEEALDEIERVEGWLSPYRPGSELVRLHRDGVGRPLRVDPRLFLFLQYARELTLQTGGAFDPTVGPLLRAWGFVGGDPIAPNPDAIAAARGIVGWQHIELDVEHGTVCLLHPGVEIHPGAVGKGFALDRALEILREAGVENALIHGGTSTVCGLGTGPDGNGWPISLPDPPPASGAGWPENGAPRIHLRDSTLSVSAVWGRNPEGDPHRAGHVLDPRTGEPVTGRILAAVELPRAAESDAWSTALLVGGIAVTTGMNQGRWWTLPSAAPFDTDGSAL